jgi:hypothetical protein
MIHRRDAFGPTGLLHAVVMPPLANRPLWVHRRRLPKPPSMLDDAYANGEKTGYVANLGHGITQWVDPANPAAFIDTVHEYSAKYL